MTLEGTVCSRDTALRRHLIGATKKSFAHTRLRSASLDSRDCATYSVSVSRVRSAQLLRVTLQRASLADSMFGSSSRTWGSGGVLWHPGNVQTTISSPRRAHLAEALPPVTCVRFLHSVVSRSGNIQRSLTAVEQGVDGAMTVLSLKVTIGGMLMPPVPADRLRLLRPFGNELGPDGITLREAGVANDEILKLQVLRARAKPSPGAPAGASLQLRCKGESSEWLHGIALDWDVSQ